MPFHIPLHDTWRPSDLVEAFRGLDIKAEVSDQRVSAVIAIVEFIGIDEFLAATTSEQRMPKKVGETTAILSFCTKRLIDNIVIDVDVNLLMTQDRYPDFGCLTNALEKCGYASGSELEIVQLYLPDDPDVARLVAEIENLGIEKENHCAAQNYVGAGAVLKEQTLLRTNLEERIRNRSR